MKGLICPKCGSVGQCYCYDAGGVEYLDVYTFACDNCSYAEQEDIRGGSPLGDNWSTSCPYCGKSSFHHSSSPILSVCVRVDCKCSYLSDWPYYPKDIIGIHRIKANDPRARIGNKWADEKTYCHGTWYSQGCEGEICDSQGEILEVIYYCKNNSHNCSFENIPDCPLERKTVKQ